MSIRARKRVEAYGEVFTSEREVNAMLDLVKDETLRIESRFLEPACGNGNFLAEILRRKLARIHELYHDSQLEFERYCFLAVGSIYGIEILEDNVEECRARLLGIVADLYRRTFKQTAQKEFLHVIAFVLKRNIVWGDALSLTKPNSDEPIVFSQWSLISGSLAKRRDYTFKALVDLPLLEREAYISDEDEDVFIPLPHREFKPVHFMDVIKNAD